MPQQTSGNPAGRPRLVADAAPKPSQTDQAHARLKTMIISGELHPAELIDASRLADALGFGRTPVREALLRLQMEGIVRILPKRGVQIVMLSADDVREIYQVISALEIEAVRLLTLTLPGMDDLAPLSEIQSRMAAAAERNDTEAWLLADEAFHRQLLELNPNRRLCDVALAHRDLVQRAHFVALRLLRSEQIAMSARQHKRLIRLIASGDAATAVESHQMQRDRGADMMVGVMRDHGLAKL